MQPDRDQATLLDMAEAARLILVFRGELDHAAFLTDTKTQSAIIHQFLIIGEAVKRLSERFKTEHPSVPWRDIARMRDKMIHHYERVNLEEVWRATQVDVPNLVAFLQPLLPTNES